MITLDKLVILLITAFFLWVSAFAHDKDLVRAAEKGTITFWSSDKTYKIVKD